MKNYPHLATRLYGMPLLIHPEKAALIERVFQARMQGDHSLSLVEDDGETPAQRVEREQARRAVAYAGIGLQARTDKPYALTTSGIALIPVMGTLIKRGSWMDSMSGLTGYDQIASLIDSATSDPEVKAILMEIDSPGGEAAGLFELGARVIQAAAAKPVWSHANEYAYSAAYALLSSADRAYAPITGGVGSIGTIAMHVDQSKRDSMMGYSYTFIYAGAKKADMNSHRPLNESGLAFLEGEVQRVNGLFVSHVADRRSLSAETVQATEAGLMSPPEALDGGFIDGVATLAETIALLESELRNTGFTTGTGMAARRSAALNQRKEMHMSTKDDKPAASAAQAGADPKQTDAKHTDAQLDAARTEAHAAGAAEGAKTGRVEGVKAEHERIRGILAHAEAKDRPQLAMSIAFESDMDMEKAAKLLAAAPKQTAGSALATLMANVRNPKVGADTDADLGAGKPVTASAASIYASRRRAA